MRITTIIFLILHCIVCNAQDIIMLTYEKAVSIALTESFNIKSHLENKAAMEHYFSYHKAQFKPLLDFDVFIPAWEESITQIDQPDGLPVYNSTGSIKAGGNLEFKYILPTGGNVSLYSNIYRANISTILASSENEERRMDQFLTRAGVGFHQPIFTKNKLKENLYEAELMYNKERNYYTQAQINIIYNVTVGFYMLYRQLRLVEISEEKLSNSKEAYRVAILKFKSKRIAEAEILIAEVEMEKDKAILLENINVLKRKKDAFKQQIGLSISQDINITTLIKIDSFDIDLEFAINEALKQRTEIANDSIDILLSEINFEKAKREREFKGEISAYYNFTGLGQEEGATTRTLIDHSINDMGVRPPNRGVFLTFSYPICDWGRASAKKQQAIADMNDARLKQTDSKVSIEREVRDIIRTIDESKERVSINKKNENLANKSYKISEMRFDNGDITSQQLAQEQERLSDAQLAFIDSYITYQLACADLKRKTMWDFKNNRSYLIEVNNQK